MKKWAIDLGRISACVAALTSESMGAGAVVVLTTFEAPEVPGTPASTGSTLFSQTAAQFPTWMASGGVVGWSVNDAVNIGEVGSASAGSAGQQFLFLSNGDVATYTFSGLAAGMAYHLDFSFNYSAASPAATPNVGSFSVSNGSSPLVAATALARDTAIGSNANTYFANLGAAIPQSLDFVATGTTLAFAFAVTGGPGTGNNHIAIDNISVSVTALPIPEPASYMMLLAGLSAMAHVARRRRPDR